VAFTSTHLATIMPSFIATIGATFVKSIKAAHNSTYQFTKFSTIFTPFNPTVWSTY
jgi:hypothetical protein